MFKSVDDVHAFLFIFGCKHFIRMSEKGKVRSGKIILLGGAGNGTSNLIYYPKDKKELAKLRQNFSWANEDYRQAVINEDINNAIAKQEDFLPFYFRHLSATIVGAWSWKATEFTDSVLKKAATLLAYKPAYVNHELEIGNIVGVNGQISYVGASKAADGSIIPGGLEGPIWVDGKLHTDLCRKLTAFPVPHIQSVSVTVSYNWQPSHEFTNREGELDDWEFEMRVGTLGTDGKMVRRVVTEITDFYETSFVFLGADPYAKILDQDGKPFNIEKSAIVGAKMFDKDPLSDLYKQQNTMFLEENSLSKENILHLNKSITNNFSKIGNSKNNSSMKKIALVGKKEDYAQDIIDALKEQNFEVSFIETKDNASELQQLNADKTKLSNELKTATDKIVEFEKIAKHETLVELAKEVELSEVVTLAKFAKKTISARKEECVRLYKLSVGDGNEVEAVIDTINKANEEALDGFLKQYGSKTIETFGAKCKSCGSTEVSFRTSKNEESGDDKPQRESLAEQTRMR